MNKKEFNNLSKLYSPLITRIINDNVRFYRFKKTIKWCFVYKEELSLMAETDRKTNIISFNLNAINYSYLTDHIMDIEYYALHEIRRVFQHLIISSNISGTEKYFSGYYFENNEYYIISIKY